MIIPFFIPHAGCPHQCVFCNQKGITGQTAPPEPSSLPQTIRSFLTTAPPHGPVQVAFYGGSFTALPQELQRSYLEEVKPFIETGSVEGIRLSTRPDALSPEIVALLKEHAVTTVELGVQSMDDRVLHLSGRGHSAQGTVSAVRLLREQAFTVGLQLMPGLPGDSPESFTATVAQVIGLRPDFVRIYPALVIKDTPLERLYRDGSYRPLALDEAIELCKDAMERFDSAGIDVIRMGLQPSEELERPGTIVAGPYHPAFRQLVQSSLLLDRMRLLLAHSLPLGPDIALCVNPDDLSSAIGQHRRNVHALQKEFGLRTVRFETDAAVPKGQVRSNRACLRSSPEV